MMAAILTAAKGQLRSIDVHTANDYKLQNTPIVSVILRYKYHLIVSRKFYPSVLSIKFDIPDSKDLHGCSTKGRSDVAVFYS